MAAAGFGSRRACEEMILDGTVTVNGEVVSELPVLVDPAKDRVVVAGKPLRSERPVYFLMNKPRGILCTHDDPDGRKRVIDLMVGVRERVFPVGRLDAESTGLILLTNDGNLTQKLTHPRFGVPKTYRAEVAGVPNEESLDKARRGIWLSDGRTGPAKIEFIHKDRDRAILEITLREGRDRELRRVLAKLGHKVLRLARIRMGKLSIAKLPIGAFRTLSQSEVKYLHELVERPEAAELPHRPQGAAERPFKARSAKPGQRPANPRPVRAPAAARRSETSSDRGPARSMQRPPADKRGKSATPRPYQPRPAPPKPKPARSSGNKPGGRRIVVLD